MKETTISLSGSVLGVWTHLETMLTRHSGHNNRMQIARVQPSRKRLVGGWLESQALCVQRGVCAIVRIENFVYIACETSE